MDQRSSAMLYVHAPLLTELSGSALNASFIALKFFLLNLWIWYNWLLHVWSQYNMKKTKIDSNRIQSKCLQRLCHGGALMSFKSLSNLWVFLLLTFACMISNWCQKNRNILIYGHNNIDFSMSGRQMILQRGKNIFVVFLAHLNQ